MSMTEKDKAQEILTPTFRALDELRIAIDKADAAGDEQVSAALIWAVCDVADTIDLVNELLKKNGSGGSDSSEAGDVGDCIDLIVR